MPPPRCRRIAISGASSHLEKIRLIDVRPSAPRKTQRGATERSALTKLPRSLVIDNVAPTVDQGRFAAKRVIGDTIAIEADAFTDDYDLLIVDLLWRPVDATKSSVRRATCAADRQ